MVVDRIFKIIDYQGLSKRAFYKSVGMSNGALDKKRDIGVSRVVNILQKYPHINPTWLLFGEEPMLLEDSPKATNTITQIGGKHNTGINAVQESKSVQGLEQQLQLLRNENEYLKKLIKNKDELLQSKSELISLLKKDK